MLLPVLLSVHAIGEYPLLAICMLDNMALLAPTIEQAHLIGAFGLMIRPPVSPPTVTLDLNDRIAVLLSVLKCLFILGLMLAIAVMPAMAAAFIGAAIYLHI